MNNKIKIGNNYGYIVNNNLKNQILNYLYNKIDLSNHRYIILDNIQKLSYLKNNEHYVSPNYIGINYILLMMSINKNNYCIIIDRKNLSYHQNQLKIININIFKLDININNSFYNGTILYGKLINNQIFLIQDCIYLMGKSIDDINMNEKINILNENIDLYLNNNNSILEYFVFKVNKLYEYHDLPNIIENIKNNLLICDLENYKVSGIIFYPKKSGINFIYIDNKKNNYENDSYNIIHNYLDFLKNKDYNFEYTEKKKLYLYKTNTVDVYELYENNNFNNKLGIALIPNLKISYMCDSLIIHDTLYKFNCIYSTKFNKWIPISLCDN